MSTCSCNFKSSLYLLLTFYISKVKNIMFCFIEKKSIQINCCPFKDRYTSKKINGVFNIVKSVDFNITDQRSFMSICFRDKHSLKSRYLFFHLAYLQSDIQ